MPHASLSNSTTSPSLLGEPLEKKHLPFLVALHSDSTTMATTGGTRSPEQTEKYLETNITHWRHHGFGLWVFRCQETGELVARGGLRRVVVEERNEVEIAYTVHASFWRRGFATEIGHLAIAHARQLGLENVVAFTLPTNEPSRRVMEKIGLTYEREIRHLGLTMVLYRLELAARALGTR
jgi:ribosomal-protein-alanine N-acetyltransferase